MIEQIQERFEEMKNSLEGFMNPSNYEAIEKAAQLMINSIHQGGKIISCGNGGSMSDAMHFAEEMTGRFRDDRSSLPAIAISDPSHITCVGNDYGFDYIFSRFVEGMGNEGDVLLAISTSGNSTNVLNAAKSAKSKSMKVVALTGKTGGELSENCDVELRAPMSEYADRVQEIHIKIIHLLIELIEGEFKSGN